MTLPGLRYGVTSQSGTPNLGQGEASGYFPPSHPQQRPYGSPQYSETARRNFDHNQHTIPGLALSQSDMGNASYQGTPVRSLPQTHVPQPEAKPASASATRHGSGPVRGLEAPGRDVSEEGEISEDEEDIYEPEEPDTKTQTGQQAAAPGKPSCCIRKTFAMQRALTCLERQRSGSYSPYLSPREIEEPQIDDYVPQLSSTETILSGSLDEAKRQAQDAVLRLSLVNVKYQDFIDQGIDKSIVANLFRDLGLNVEAEHEKHSAPKQPKAASPSAAKQEPPKTIPKNVEANKVTKVEPPKGPRNAAEERKDRIARLLAAKKGKASPESSARVTPQISNAAQSKGNLEKSKLLQQKMEALLKSREALQRGQAVEEPSHSQPETTKAENENGPKSPRPAATVAISSPMRIPTAPRAMLKQRGKPQAPFDRSLHQNKTSRPFLIDVSDDDGDDEMELDSVEQDEDEKPFQDSPALVATPQSDAVTESDELSNMKLKIEAMKKRIAEAEARKKARQSRQGSPESIPAPTSVSKTLAVEISQERLAETDDALDTLIAEASLPVIESSPPKLSPATFSKVSEARSISRDRSVARGSRAASERLPAIEARRKEQMLKLKALQSQMANIQKDIDDSFLEEQRLKEDVSSDMEVDEGDDPDVEFQAVQEQAAPALSSSGSVNEQLAQPQLALPVVAEPADTLEAALEVEQEELGKSIQQSHKGVVSKEAGDDDSSETTSDTSSDDDASGLPDASDEEDVSMDDGSDQSDDEVSDAYEPAEAEAAEPTSEEDIAIHDQVHAQAEPREESPERLDVASAPTTSLPTAPRSSFVPYDSPLHYFRSFRFHPQFHDQVQGGLRSLTYSNQIDARQPLCPDELAGRDCPRGRECEFQHFNVIQAPGTRKAIVTG